MFLLCPDALSSLPLFEEEVGGIDGIRVSRNASSVADESLIFMKVNMKNAISLPQVIDTYFSGLNEG